MIEFLDQSQCGQGRFARELIGDTGTFLDIGANHPTIISNTWGLEELGWTGVLVENDPAFIPLLQTERTSRLIAQDARKIDWKAELQIPVMDYLSLDVDAASEVVLARLMENGPRFNVLTVETDEYAHGAQRRINMAAQLRFHGYDILCDQVCHEGLPYEIWAVDTAFAMRKLTRETLDKFTCKEPKEGKDFWK